MQERDASWYRVALTTPLAFWLVWAGVNIALGAVALTAPGWPLGDVLGPYKFWSGQLFSGTVMGIDMPFVYPYVALAPMLLPWLAGDAAYGLGWVLMIAALNTCAVGLLTRWGRVPGRLRFGWWWTGFLICLGPVAIGRIDAVALGMTLIVLTTVLSRPRVASSVLTAAAWIKVWPAAILLSLWSVLHTRRTLFWTAVWVSLGILVFGIALGGARNVLSFVTEQGARSLQVEAVVATPWMLARLAGAPGVDIVYDQGLMTNVFNDAGSLGAARAVSIMMPIAVVLTVFIAVVAQRRGTTGHRILPPLALALVAELIVFNKVGSPQFMCWFVAPAALYLVLSARGRRCVLVTVLVVAALTQSFYPYTYVAFLSNSVPLVAAFTVRNVLIVVLLSFAVTQLMRLALTPVTRVPTSPAALAR